jgi:tRNA dimethylallyltransferase
LKTEERVKSPVLFLVGPTASGKTNLAISLAKMLDGEIVCADSQTLRKDLNIGTAKPTIDEMYGVVHHMIDVIEPYERFSVNQFKSMATEKIRDIQKRGKIPIIVGGSGLYIDALFFDFDLDEQTDNLEYKKKLEALSTRELQEMIIARKYPMPENKENPRHLIGMLLRGGLVNENKRPIDGAVIYGLMPDDETLKSRINLRVEKMFEDGFIDEVKDIVSKYGQPPEKLDAIGYPIGAKYITDELTLERAKENFKSEHWQYARRQRSWFKRNPYIQWFSSGEEAMNTIKKNSKLL